MTKTKVDYYEKLDELYCGDVPDYVTGAGKTYIIFNASDVFDNVAKRKITLKDVIRYYAYEAPSFKSLRTLGSIPGDWRAIDNMAKECLEYFKLVNKDALKTESRKYGMELKG
jgi:hypothetical protein